jgi:acetolactate decarboxylase
MSMKRRQLDCRVSQTLWDALETESSRTGDSISHIVERALANELDLRHHSLFQVSTSSALVEGVFDGCTRVHDLKLHGDFGLGTFEGLDGEMVMLDGVCYQISGGGIAREVADSSFVPFASITRFVADHHFQIIEAESFEGLLREIDLHRPSENLFVAFRIDGHFENISLRAACKAQPGEKLVDAIEHQSEFQAEQEMGTLVGFWTPPYATAISVPGYHFHFINAAGSFGGHVFDLVGKKLQVGMHVETDIHLAIPEAQQFLTADLSADNRAALERAEKKKRVNDRDA